MLGACRLREGSLPAGIIVIDYCPVCSAPGGQRPIHGPVSCYQQSRQDRLQTIGRKWSRAVAHHSTAVPYVRQDSARHQYDPTHVMWTQP